MLEDLRILAIIPARGGSKGIKKKNISVLKGKPLIAYTIEAAQQSKYIDNILVSTDSKEIAEVCKTHGVFVPFFRPDSLAGDQAKIIDAVLYSLEKLRSGGEIYSTIILLQPTQPLRTSDDIDAALREYYKQGQQALVSVCSISESPILMRSIKDGKLKRLLGQNSTVRRQDMPIYYKVNGCIYINAVSELTSTTSFNDNLIPFIMSREHSVDIDEAKDLVQAEILLQGK